MERGSVNGRYVDTKEYVSVMRDLVNEGKEVSMLVAGSSMSPFLIHYRDTIYFAKPERALRAGDMVFYQRDNGQFIMHRIIRVRRDGCYDIVGDNQTEIERGVRRDQIFAIITKVKRKGKWIGPGDFWWVFFAQVWRRIIPVRRTIARCYAAIKK